MELLRTVYNIFGRCPPCKAVPYGNKIAIMPVSFILILRSQVGQLYKTKEELEGNSSTEKCAKTLTWNK